MEPCQNKQENSNKMNLSAELSTGFGDRFFLFEMRMCALPRESYKLAA